MDIHRSNLEKEIIDSINSFGKAFDFENGSGVGRFRSMNTVFTRITKAEGDLGNIKEQVARLATTLADLKAEVRNEVEEPVVNLPPPMPNLEPEPERVILDKKPEVEPKLISTSPPKESRPDRSGLELQLGRVWFVRIGIILLVTGFVFLSHYSYNAFIHDLGPGVRLGLLYLLSAATAGAGLFFERSKKSLQSYGRIVAAGGLAALYYCGFAASHVEPLKVISSPVLGSILLTGSAGLLCAISLWRKSRVMLSTSLGLAFYSVSITPPGWLALLSAFILTTFGIVMMVRTRWMETGFIVMAGSYLAHVWWQVAGGGVTDGLPWFLVAYWMLFTASSFVSAKTLKEEFHALFCTINHTAFFLLFSFDFSSLGWIEGQWIFALALGVAMLALGVGGRNHFPGRTVIIHLIKSIGLITLGISLKLSGYQLFLSLLIESGILMAIGMRYPHPAGKAASYVVAALAGGLSIQLLDEGNSGSSFVWVVAMILWWLLALLDRRKSAGSSPLVPSFVFAVMAQLSLTFGIMAEWQHVDRTLVIGGIGLLSLGALFFDKARAVAREIFWVNVALVLPAIISLHERVTSPSSWLLVGGLGLLMTVGHFFRETKADSHWEGPLHRLFGGLHLLVAVISLTTAIHISEFTEGAQFLLLLLLPLTGLLVSLHSNRAEHLLLPWIAGLGLIEINVWTVEPGIWFVGAVIQGTHFHLLRRYSQIALDGFEKVLEPLLLYSSCLFYIAGLLGSLDHPGYFLSWSAAGMLALHRQIGRVHSWICGTAFLILGSAAAFLTGGGAMALFVCQLPIFGLHLWYSRQDHEVRFSVLVILSLLLLWFRISSQVEAGLATAWAIYGTVLLLIGLGCRSRPFRMTALVILAATLGHIMLIDVIKLDPLPRILSFLTLGVGLLGLGFVYNRFQDRLKSIL